MVAYRLQRSSLTKLILAYLQLPASGGYHQSVRREGHKRAGHRNAV